ncbi:APC family permease [Haloplanus salinarum]
MLLFGFVVNLFVMLAYAELATMFPKAGQIYEYTKQGFENHKTAIFLATGVGTAYWLIFGLVFAAEVSAGAHAIHDTLGGTGSVMFWVIVINLVAILFNMRGLKTAVIAETILVITMVSIRVFMGLASFSGLSQAGSWSVAIFTDPLTFGLAGVYSAITLGVWAFIGLEFATPLVEEVRNPQKNIPKGMTAGILIILFMALTMGIGIIGTVSPVAYNEAYLGNAPQIVIAGILFGTTGEVLAGIASFAATLGGVNVAYAAIPRVLYAMSREGLWPEFLSWKHPEYDSPWVAIWATAVIFITPVFISSQVVALINAATAVWLLSYVWVLLLVLKLRHTHPEIERPIRTNVLVYGAGLVLILFTLWKAYQGAYNIVLIAIGIFAVGHLYSGAWIKLTGDPSAKGISEAAD